MLKGLFCSSLEFLKIAFSTSCNSVFIQIWYSILFRVFISCTILNSCYVFLLYGVLWKCGIDMHISTTFKPMFQQVIFLTVTNWPTDQPSKGPTFSGYEMTVIRCTGTVSHLSTNRWRVSLFTLNMLSGKLSFPSSFVLNTRNALSILSWIIDNSYNIRYITMTRIYLTD